MSWDYGTLAAEIYELDKPIGHSFGDVEYYLRLLRGTRGKILEPAAGTGRILIPLLEADLDVEALDTSPAMLAVCRQHCRERGLDPVVREADMTGFTQPGAYEAVILPAGSITLLDGPGQTLAALGCFRDSLAPSGRLIIDIPPPELVTGPEPLRYWRRGQHLWTLQTIHIEYDSAANQTTRFLRYDKWCDGALLTTELQLFRLQRWSALEFQQLLAQAGFTGIHVTADYRDDHPPSPDSVQWTFHASRR